MTLQDCKLYLIDRDELFNELKKEQFDTYQIMTIIKILDEHDERQRNEQAIIKNAAKEVIA